MVYIALLSFSFLLEFAQTYLMQWTGQKVMFDLRSQIYRHLQQMHVAFFDRNPVGRLVTRVTTDVDALNEMFTAGVVSIFEDVFVLAGIIAIMLNMSWQLALIAFAVLPLIYIGTAIFRKHVRDSYRRIRVAIARINAYLQEHVTGIVPLQLFNREEKAYAEFKAINATHMLAYQRRHHGLCALLPRGGNSFGYRRRFHHLVWRPPDSRRDAHARRAGGLHAVCAALLPADSGPEREVQHSAVGHGIQRAHLQTAGHQAGDRVEARCPACPTAPEHIEFDHVWFAYRRIPLEDPKQPGPPALATHGSVPGTPGAPHCRRGRRGTKAPVAGDWDWVLRDVSFTVKPGETAAVVGHTGAGKTTLISLLLRFYDVQQGAIRLDGVDIRELDLQGLRRKFGVVLQDPFLFSGTIESNIRLGSESVDLAAVERAAEEVNLSEFIRSLPEGFQSHTKERGSTLSTGQKQLISFARALAHNPKILILDEATSSVDTETEFRVREALSRMVEGRTSLIIAHRLSTIQRADNIIVMHKGKVREMGTHQQLLAQRGIYYKLYQLSTGIRSLRACRCRRSRWQPQARWEQETTRFH